MEILNWRRVPQRQAYHFPHVIVRNNYKLSFEPPESQREEVVGHTAATVRLPKGGGLLFPHEMLLYFSMCADLICTARHILHGFISMSKVVTSILFECLLHTVSTSYATVRA